MTLPFKEEAPVTLNAPPIWAAPEVWRAPVVEVETPMPRPPVRYPEPATDKVAAGDEEPIPTRPALVILNRSVKRESASLRIPKEKSPAVDEAYQCLRSAPAPVSVKSNCGRDDVAILTREYGVDVPIPNLPLVASTRKNDAEESTVPPE